MVESHHWNLRGWGSDGYVHNPTHKHEKCGHKAIKMVFIRYPTHSKGYMTYREKRNGSMTEIKSYNVGFLENEFPSIGKIKKHLELYELQQDLQPFVSEGEDLNSSQVTEDVEPVQGNELCPHSPTSVKSQPENAESPLTQDPMP